MITAEEILKDRIKYTALPPASQSNLNVLLNRINLIRKEYGHIMVVTSGYRSPQLNNSLTNSAKASKHLTCQAVDIADSDCELWYWCIANLDFLQSIGLWLEDKHWTPTWVHFQTVPPNSKRRIFIPSSAKPLASGLWSGTYDPKYDSLVAQL